MKKLSIMVLLTMLCFESLLMAQDTLYYKKTQGYESIVLIDGYHLVFYANIAGQTDTVFQYEYGHYMKTRIIDISIHNYKHTVLYGNGDMIGYTIHDYWDNAWHPYMGNILVFFTPTRYKVDVSIVDGDKFKIIEDGQETLYQINFTNKTLERYDK
jgi:hypothetical protein